ncbi:hypothetical protein IE53DRAFT_168807 [Violaceomyces palustris]|uniref:Uncharacterized protein n=1 Tax=Violaceomyces palustris TaxID=1673888 RepID=A0ACD0NT68_9BASI|nr:hypothetical protein IE53DRAFT_168807 [Violaceomyces palustris]
MLLLLLFFFLRRIGSTTQHVEGRGSIEVEANLSDRLTTSVRQSVHGRLDKANLLPFSNIDSDPFPSKLVSSSRFRLRTETRCGLPTHPLPHPFPSILLSLPPPAEMSHMGFRRGGLFGN